MKLFIYSESGTMESMSANLDATDDLVPSLQQVNKRLSIFEIQPRIYIHILSIFSWVKGSAVICLTICII